MPLLPNMLIFKSFSALQGGEGFRMRWVVETTRRRPRVPTSPRPSPPPGRRGRWSLRHLEQPRRTHAAADAHGDDDALGAAALAFDECVTRHARAAHPIGMADRDGAAIDIVFRGIDAEPVAAIERLHGEGLVQLPEIDVVDLEAMPLEQLGHGEDRADAHLVGLAAGDDHAAIDPQRLEPALLRELSIHEHAGGRTVRELARIPR